MSAVKPGDTVIMSWPPRQEVLGSRRADRVTLVADGDRVVTTTDIFT
jgi:hypothetical protein